MQQVNSTTFDTEKGRFDQHNFPRTIKIGGKNPNVWVPNLNMPLWDNESYLNFNAPIQANKADFIEFVNGPHSHPLLSNRERVQWTHRPVLGDPNKDLQIFSFDLNETVLEFGVVYAEKPSDMIAEYKIAHRGLEFLEQFSAQQLYDQGKIEDLSQWDCPANVANGFAVYRKGKINGVYKTGKVGMFYRHHVLDANMQSAWCTTYYEEINEEEAKFVITMPSEFMENAQYPVILMGAGDTFGYTTTPSSDFSPGNVGERPQQMASGPYTSRAGYIDIGYVNVRSFGGNPGTTKMGLFTDNASKPDVVVAQTPFFGSYEQYEPIIWLASSGANYYYNGTDQLWVGVIDTAIPTRADWGQPSGTTYTEWFPGQQDEFGEAGIMRSFVSPGPWTLRVGAYFDVIPDPKKQTFV